MNIKQAIQSTQTLTSNERALLAHCLISSLDTIQDEDVDEAWVKLSAKRFLDLESAAVNSISWDELKSEIRS